MIRARYDNLQRQRNKGGGRKDVGHAFADAGSSGKTGIRRTPRGARSRGDRGRGGRGGRCKGGNEGEKYGENKNGQTNNSSNARVGNIDRATGGNARCNRCGEVGHKTVQCPGQV